jgi:lipid II:glycine glycyltransferase (peptidoglycan interpeptide bridge formation enzyme)
MKSFQVIKVSDSAWTNVISSACKFDFYHTRTYSSFEKTDEPLMCVAYYNKDFIALPVIIRKIPNTGLSDCTSVYGYCGPVSNLPFDAITSEHIRYFQQELLHFFESRQIISAFCRLHPVFDQTPVFDQFGSVRGINQTVGIDLKLSADEQFSKYRESHRRKIRKLRKEGFSVYEATSKEEIAIFTDIYNDNMKRLNADSSYYCNEEYFMHFLHNSCFKATLLLAKKENVITSGGLFVLANKIMQYHFSGIKDEFRQYAPMKLIIDEARLVANANHLEFLHLGGGLNGSSDDSLFYFKAGFSDRRFLFSVWQMIVDEPKYSEMMALFNIDGQKESNYFPAYRAR